MIILKSQDFRKINGLQHCTWECVTFINLESDFHVQDNMKHVQAYFFVLSTENLLHCHLHIRNLQQNTPCAFHYRFTLLTYRSHQVEMNAAIQPWNKKQIPQRVTYRIENDQGLSVSPNKITTILLSCSQYL